MRLKETKRFYRINDLVDMGYASRTTIFEEIKAGLLPAVKLNNGRILIPVDDFDKMIADHKIAPTRDEA